MRLFVVRIHPRFRSSKKAFKSERLECYAERVDGAYAPIRRPNPSSIPQQQKKRSNQSDLNAYLLVEAGGFGPPKLTQQIYSLPPLATRERFRI